MELRRKRAATPQKSSRLQPSEPLHMTTRTASKAGSVSSNGASSRRGSFISNGQMSPLGGNENDGDRYPKRRRISTGSKSTPIRAQNASQSSSTASRPSTRSMSGGNLHPIAESPLPRRKRKRSSDVTAENISVAHPSRGFHQEEVIESFERNEEELTKIKRSSTSSRDQTNGQGETLESNNPDSTRNEPRDDRETVAVNENVQNTSEMDVHGAANGTDESHEAENTMSISADGGEEKQDASYHHANESQESVQSFGASQEVNDVPHESLPSAANELNEPDDAEEDDEEEAEGDYDEDAEMDDARDELTVSKEPGAATMDPTPVVSALASPAGSIPDSSADRESPTKRMVSVAAGGASFSTAGGEKPTKRLPGRRRAPHPNPKVEAALRRQLHLRMTYRAVAKNLKPLLTELSKRSLNSLHADAEAHTKASEYPVVKDDLFYHFEQRLAWVQTKKELDKKRLSDMLEEQTTMRKRQYEHVARTIKEDFAVRLQHDFLNTLRKQQQEQDYDYSDDEDDDVIPPLRRVTRKGGVGSILGPDYHWRSRPFLETERLFDELQDRDCIARQHYDHDKVSASEDSRPFTTFDPVHRKAAQTSRKIQDLMRALEDASKETTVVPPVQTVVPPLPPPTISNSEAKGLQLLASASASTYSFLPAGPGLATAINTNSAADEIRQEDLTVPRPSLSRTESQATPAPSSQTPAQQDNGPEQRAMTTGPISFSQAVLEPSIKETAPPVSMANIQSDQRDQILPPPGLTQLPSLDQMVSERSHENTLPQITSSSVASLPIPTPSKPAPVDFWSSLARGSYETDAHGKVKLAPKSSLQDQTSTEAARTPQEPANPQDRESRPSLPASSTILEPLSQRLRSTSDSFGPLIDRPGQIDSPRTKKGPAPKKSLFGPWPRGRNYNPLDRRASTTGPRPQENLPGLHPRPSGDYGSSPYSPTEVRHSSYGPPPPPPPQPPMQGFPTSAPQSGPYIGGPLYAATPPPPSYPYDQRGQPYPTTQLAPYQGPTAFTSLPGAPSSQPPPPQYYGAPHTLPPPTTVTTGYPPSNLTSRPPPTPPPYGPQYGGQPILPAGHDPRYGQNGAAPATAAPAFAQYQQHDGRRRRNQSLGHREFQHYHGPR